MSGDLLQTRDEGSPSGPSAVYEVLRSRIVSGLDPPGTRLVEGVLAKTFGTSRSPIREALSQLAYEGLVERHDRAMRVRVLKAEDVLEIYEVRIALERAAARAAAERRTDLDLARLGGTLDQMLALSDDDTDSRPKLSHAFHFALWRATHNTTLEETLENVHLRVMGLSSTTLHYPSRWAVFTDECGRLLEAIRCRDVTLAGEIAEEQMTNARDFRLKLYSANPGQLPARLPAGR
jgi:DNA-binding GntR family transcriptional regulator